MGQPQIEPGDATDGSAFLLDQVSTSPEEMGAAAVKADAAPLVILGMIEAGLSAEDLRLGFRLAGEPEPGWRWPHRWRHRSLRGRPNVQHRRGNLPP